MAMLSILAMAALILALIPAVLTIINSILYRPAPRPDGLLPSVSILIPARNEEQSIGPAVKSALASRGVDLEVVVLDDHSTDGTANVVTEIAKADGRVRLIDSPPLPPNWCGKQHACHVLAQATRHSVLVFVDADVRLEPDSVPRLIAFHRQSRANLVSGIPRQETGTFVERLVIPVIHFLLLGYLPIIGMRLTRMAGFGAGCGQLFLTTRDAYQKSGGHSAIRSSMHDGLTLPRAYRRAGLMTDLCDATDLASCRMYRSACELWMGLSKNAREGLASPLGIVPWTLILFGGHVLPFLLLFAVNWLDAVALQQSVAAVALSYYPRVHNAVRFRQSWLGAVLHPVGVLILLSIQWYSVWRRLIGRPVGWKGR